MSRNAGILLFCLGLIAVIGTLLTAKKDQPSNTDTVTRSENIQSVPKNETKIDNEKNKDFTVLDCKPASKVFYDGIETNNEAGKTGLMIDFSNETYARYDSSGRDVYKGQFAVSGIYTNIQSSSPNGVMIKVQTDELVPGDENFLDYMEVATLGLGSFISYGQCQKVNGL